MQMESEELTHEGSVQVPGFRPAGCELFSPGGLTKVG